MKNVKLVMMALMLVAFGIAAVTAQPSEHQTRNGHDDYRNRVAIEIATIEGFGEFLPFHHQDGVEIGGKVTTLTLVDPQFNNQQLIARNKQEMKHHVANQGISIWVPDTSSMLYIIRKNFALHLKYNNEEFPFDASLHMDVPEDSTKISKHNFYPVTDSTQVELVGFLKTHYPSFSEQENMVREYRTDIRTVVMEKEKTRVQNLKDKVHEMKDEMAQHELEIVSLMPALESDKAEKRKMKKELDSLKKVNRILASNIVQAESFQAKHTEEMDEKVEAYVRVYKKHVCDFFAFGGVIFDGIQTIPASEIETDKSLEAYNGQGWINKGKTCIPAGAMNGSGNQYANQNMNNNTGLYGYTNGQNVSPQVYRTTSGTTVTFGNTNYPQATYGYGGVTPQSMGNQAFQNGYYSTQNQFWNGYYATVGHPR